MKILSKAFATTALAASLALIGAAPASAEILASGSDPKVHKSPGVFELTFDSAATVANLSFDLIGNKSLDGFNAYTDIFTLAVNGTSILFGTFNMGGGGSSFAFGPSGFTWETTTNGCAANPCTDTTWLGGKTEISLPISLQSGTNTILFSYVSPRGPFAGPQGRRDESWTVSDYLITAVPEPETYAMLLAGLGLVGVAVRRRKQAEA